MSKPQMYRASTSVRACGVLAGICLSFALGAPAAGAQESTPRPNTTAPRVEQATPEPTRGAVDAAPRSPDRVRRIDPPKRSAEQPAERSATETATGQAGDAPVRTSDAPALSTLLNPRPVPPLPDLARLGVSNDAVLPLTLNDAVRRALENNNDIEIARGDVRRAESTLVSLEAVYDPIFTFAPNINNRVTPVASALGGSDRSGTVTTTGLSFDAGLTKPFRTGGGRYDFFFTNVRERTSSIFSQLNPFYSSSSGVTLTQPLLRDRSIDLNRRSIRVGRKTLQQSDADFRRQTIAVIADVQRAYWELVFALRDAQNRMANLQRARELFKQTEQRIEAGGTAPFERAEVQTELSSREADLLGATRNVTVAETNLKLLILPDTRAAEWSSALVPTDAPVFDETPILLSDVLAEARANRPELSRLKLQEEISRIDLAYFENQTRPRLDLVSTVATTGLAGSPVVSRSAPGGVDNALPESLVGGYGRTLRNLAGLGTRNISVGVRIEIPFRNRRARADLAIARIAQAQLGAARAKQEQLVEAEVRLAAQNAETARRQVLAAREARRSAALQLEGERRLYEVGRATTFLLFQRENALVNARTFELRAEIDYNRALADLGQATSTALRAYNIIVEVGDER